MFLDLLLPLLLYNNRYANDSGERGRSMYRRGGRQAVLGAFASQRTVGGNLAGGEVARSRTLVGWVVGWEWDWES